jgi:nucleoside-diphosphate-sugar epimerase
MTRTVLVVGAAGFLGAHVCAAFGRAGARVHALGPTLAEVERVGRDHGVALTPAVGLLADAEQTAQLVDGIAPDVIVNCAGYGVRPGEDDPLLLSRVNCDVPAWLAAHCGSAALLHVGSGAEYGDVGGHLPEDGPAHPVTPYGAAKLAGTRAVLEAARGAVTVIRPFTVYGHGEAAGRLLPSLMAAAHAGTEVRLGDGLARRDFTHVGDVAEALVRLADAPCAEAEIVNVATGVLTSVRAFVETAADELGLPRSRLRFGALPPGRFDVELDRVTVERLRRRVAWTPSTTPRA